MKELSIEEKAKRYDEAIKRAKKELASCGNGRTKMLKRIFPELKESKENEDEKIKGAAIEFIRQNNSFNYCLGISKEEVLAWLEKQGEHAKFRDSIQVGDKVTRNRDGMLVNLSQLERVAKPADTEKGAKGNDREIPISAWSKEDEARFESCIEVLQTSDGYDTINAKWLKSLKGRVQPQQQEWSEKDERMFKNTIALIETL